MHQSPTLDGLRELDRDELEERFAAEGELRVPVGRYRGEHLCWIHAPEASPWWRPVLKLAFVRMSFGIDFDHRRWFFMNQRARLGRFNAETGPSRWRDTRSVRLTYDQSRLPRPIRSTLYDELKPLSDTLCLGMGGINAEHGAGEHFFFALRRVG